MKLRAVREASSYMSLNKTLAYCGMSKRAWYYANRPRDMPINADVASRVRQVVSRYPTYGTHRMTAQVAREAGMPTNRKRTQ